MNPVELKNYIKEDTDRVITILENLECHSIKKSGIKAIQCGMPTRNSKTSVYVKLQNLSTSVFYPDSKSVKGDIFTLVMELKDLTFPKSIRYLHDLFKLKYTFYNKDFNQDDSKPNVLKLYKQIRKQSNTSTQMELENVPDYILNRYDKISHMDFIKDNIVPSVMDKFDIRFSDEYNRILIPHFKWDTGEVVGIFGRTVLTDFDERGVAKYMGVIPYSKSNNLYGLSHNYKDIQEKGYVVVAEAEKSCLQACSFGENTLVAVGCHDISPIQLKILLSLNVDIIIGFDKGVSQSHIDNTCAMFKGRRRTFYLNDIEGLLNDKDSPTDSGRSIFNYLMNNKAQYKFKQED